MSKGKVLSGASATLVIAGLSLRRLLRSRLILIIAIFAALPLLPLLVGAGDMPDTKWNHFFPVAAVVQLLVASLLMAPAIAEEISDKTYTYLWSRPFPRWAILAGKLLTGACIGIAVFTTLVVAAYVLTGLGEPNTLIRGIVGLSAGVIAVGCIAASFGILMPSYPLAFSIAYFLVVDFALGMMPFAGAKISVFHHILAIGLEANEESLPVALLWLTGLSAFWLTIGLWRLGRRELSTGS